MWFFYVRMVAIKLCKLCRHRSSSIRN